MSRVTCGSFLLLVALLLSPAPAATAAQASDRTPRTCPAEWDASALLGSTVPLTNRRGKVWGRVRLYHRTGETPGFCADFWVRRPFHRLPSHINYTMQTWYPSETDSGSPSEAGATEPSRRPHVLAVSSTAYGPGARARVEVVVRRNQFDGRSPTARAVAEVVIP
jgi:hypothetical protein